MKKIFLLIVGLLLVSYILDAQCLEGTCKTGHGIYLFTDGSKYTGEFLNGLPEGKGEWIYPAGEKIKGSFKEGLPIGEEAFAKASPDRAIGCISGNCKNGIGVHISPSGVKYVGYFKKSEPSGKGVCYYPNGNRYDGLWKDGQRHGKGIMLVEGEIKEGVWKKGSFDRTKKSQEHSLKASSIINRYAVVIGIADYEKMELLDYADDDAYSFYRYLENKKDLKMPADNIRFLIDQNATASRIKEAITDVAKKAGPNDEIIIYYSGHGIAKAIIPFESDGKTGLVTHHEVKQILSESKAISKTLYLDACNKTEAEANIMESSGLGGEMNVFYSSRIGQNSLESNELKQGVFSYYLVQGLMGKADENVDGNISNKELFHFIFENVQRYTDQRQFPTFASSTRDPFGG